MFLEHASGLRPTSEALMHLMIYRTRKDARAIVHTHSMYGTTFALLNKPIPAIVYEVANFGLTKARISGSTYGRPGTMELADSVVEVCEGGGMRFYWKSMVRLPLIQEIFTKRI